MATYSGVKGTRLMQQIPAEHVPGRRREPVPVVSVGLRVSHVERPLAPRRAAGAAPRRLSNGFTATLDYTLATATDTVADGQPRRPPRPCRHGRGDATLK
jgi:hypothetical protein